MRNAFLVGENVYLRPLDREDAESIVPWLNDHEVTRTLLWYRPANLASEEQFLDNLYGPEKADLLLGITLREGDRLIGVVGLHRLDSRARHANLGIMIGEKSEWGKGRGTEATRLIVRHAFEGLNLNRVWLEVHADHEHAIHAYERAGFKREGVLRQHAFREGRYVDEVVMGVLREEKS